MNLSSCLVVQRNLLSNMHHEVKGEYKKNISLEWGFSQDIKINAEVNNPNHRRSATVILISIKNILSFYLTWERYQCCNNNPLILRGSN